MMSEITYENWYNDWMKRLAKNKTKQELMKEYERVSGELHKAAEQHFNAVKNSTSMQSNSQARANARNKVETKGDYKIALSGAIEIHEKFPEHAKQG